MRRGVAVLVAVLSGASILAQTQEPRFRRDVAGVRLDVRIVDRDGRFVRGLAKDDIAIFEDGKEQAISSFELVDVPVGVESPRTAPIIDSDVASNAAAADGRVYLMVLDDLHTHPLRSVTVRELAREFIERNFGPNDLGAIIATSSRREMATEFTSNRGRLLDTAARFEGGFSRGAYCGNDHDYCQADEHRTMKYLATLARWLAGVDDRRKALLFISEGFDSGISNVFGSTQGDGDSRHVIGAGSNFPTTANLAGVTEAAGDAHDLIDAAARSNVSIFAIDPRGLPGAAAPTIKPVPTLGDDSAGQTVIAQQGLESLAEATGGFALVRSNAFSDAFARLVTDTSSYYLIGYTSSNTNRDGKYRRVQVRTKRAGLTARTRAGYVAQNGQTTAAPARPGAVAPELAGALSSPLQVPGLALTMSAVAFKSEKSKASVQVVVEAHGSELPLSIAVVAANPDGDIKAEEHGTLDLKASGAAPRAPGDQRVRLVSRIALQPGRYHLRAAGLDRAGTRGSVHFDLDVPDFGKGPLALGGVVLVTTPDTAPTGGSDQSWKGQLPGPPTAMRMFDASDRLTLFTEIYDNAGKAGDAVDVTTTITSATGETPLTRVDRVTARSGKERSAASAYSEIVPLTDVRPGRYVLGIDVRRTANGTTTCCGRFRSPCVRT